VLLLLLQAGPAEVPFLLAQEDREVLVAVQASLTARAVTAVMLHTVVAAVLLTAEGVMVVMEVRLVAEVVHRHHQQAFAEQAGYTEALAALV